MDKLVNLALTHDMASLLVHALRDYQTEVVARILEGKADAYDQPGQLAWLATYIEHKLRDAR